jgi:hypothetical protein
VDERLGDRHGAELRGGQLADDDEATAAQLGHVVVVEGEHQVRHGRRAEAGGGAAHDVEVLDADGHALERRRRVAATAARAYRVLEPRRQQGAAAKDVGERVELGLVALDAVEVEAGQLLAGNFAALNPGRLLKCAGAQEVMHCGILRRDFGYGKLSLWTPARSP